MGDIRLERYLPNEREKWDIFNSASKNPLFMFDRNYMDYHNDRFSDHSLMFYEDDNLVALLPGNESSKIYYSHGGLTYGGLIIGCSVKQHTVNSCIDSLITYLSINGFDCLMYKAIPHIYHAYPCEEDLYALHSRGAVLKEISASTVIDLGKQLKMSKGRKAQISRAGREGVEICEITAKEGYKHFIDLENEVLESRHNTHTAHTSDELFLLYERFPNNIHLYGAFYRGDMIAGTVVFEYAEVIHTQYMAANELARKIGALDLCVQSIIERFQSSKKWLDFGISTENGGRCLNEGLVAQKESFGGRTNIYQLWELCIQK